MRDGLSIDFSQHLDGLGKIGLEIPAHDVEEFYQNGVAEGVEDVVSVFPVQHELPAAQNGQMLRKVRLFQTEPLLKDPAGKLPFSQNLDNGDASRMGQRLKDIRLISPQRIVHTISIFAPSNIRNSCSGDSPAP
jgi:hypothetical protein